VVFEPYVPTYTSGCNNNTQNTIFEKKARTTLVATRINIQPHSRYSHIFTWNEVGTLVAAMLCAPISWRCRLSILGLWWNSSSVPPITLWRNNASHNYFMLLLPCVCTTLFLGNHFLLIKYKSLEIRSSSEDDLGTTVLIIKATRLIHPRISVDHLVCISMEKNIWRKVTEFNNMHLNTLYAVKFCRRCCRKSRLMSGGEWLKAI
jgi:hypothetical protein